MKWTDKEVKLLQSHVNSQKTINEISVDMGRTRNSIKQKLNSLGLVATKAKSGVDKRYTDDQLEAAIVLWSFGRTSREVAEETGINHGTLRKLMSEHRNLFPRRETTKAFCLVDKPTPETVVIQYEFKEYPMPDDALMIPFEDIVAGQCTWLSGDFWDEPKNDTPCCGKNVYDLRGKGGRRYYCEFHYRISVEEVK